MAVLDCKRIILFEEGFGLKLFNEGITLSYAYSLDALKEAIKRIENYLNRLSL